MKIFLGGVAALVVGIILLIFWIDEFLTVLLGMIPVVLLVGGAFAAYSGYDEIREKMAGEPEKVEPTFETKPAETTPEPSEVDSVTAEEKKPERPKAPKAPRKSRPRKKGA